MVSLDVLNLLLAFSDSHTVDVNFVQWLWSSAVGIGV
jgi:hypothetical protein